MGGEKRLLKYLCNQISLYIFTFFIFCCFSTFAQTSLYTDIPVSDNGSNNSIGSANTSRNVVVDANGNIYVVYTNLSQIRIAKSTNGGQSFLPSVLVANTSTSVEPEIAVNNTDILYIAWVENDTINFTRSLDGAASFSAVETFGTINNSNADVHMSAYENNVYLTDQDGINLYYNNNAGVGGFNLNATGLDMVYADVLTDQNGVLFVPMDDPNLVLFKSTDIGSTLNSIALNPAGRVFYSSYALSDGPCGTFIFVGGGGTASQSETLGYKINTVTGETTEINLGVNSSSFEGRTLYADKEGTLIDGYKASNGNLMISISSDQGNSFASPIVVAKGDSHNITKSPVTNNIAVTYQRNGRIFLSVFDNILKTVEIDEPNPPLVFCSNQNFNLSFTLSGVFSSGSLFSVRLSDENGNFSNSVEIGTLITDTSGVINCTIPNGLTPSNLYRIRIESVANCIQSNTVPMSLGEGSITGNAEACEGETIQLTSTGTPNSTSPWTSSNTNIATVDNNGIVTTLTAGTTEITFTTDIGCMVSHSIEVFENPTINQNINFNECENTSNGTANFNTSTLESTLLNGQTTMTISYFNSSGNSLPSPLPNPFNSSNQTITARIENAQQNECFTEVEIEFTVNTLPSIHQIMPQEICDDDFDTIGVFDTSTLENSILNGQVDVEVYYFDESGLALPSPLPNPFHSENQTITVRLENKDATNCFVETSIDFIVREKPTILLDDEADLCINNNPSLAISVNNPDALYTYIWTDENGTQVGTGETITVTHGGVYYVIATSEFMCTSEEESIRITEFNSPQISENDIILSANNNSININTAEIPAEEFEYGLLNINGDFVFSFQDSPVFNQLDFGLYTVLVRSKNNCGSDRVLVSLIHFPDFFTPNGDGVNETWTIKGFNRLFYPISSAYIFNRYGKLMAKLPVENLSWNGLYNGTKMPPTDYWYQITLTDIYGRTREENGHFSLLRR